MKPRHLLALLLALLVALAPPLSAQTPLEGPPKLIDYQGTALDLNGNPLAPATPTNYTMKFRLYTAQSGGSPIWSEQQTVTVSNGQFSVRVGQGIAVGAEPRPDLSTVFTGKDRYLGLTIVIPPQAEGEITPRLAFLSSPFSFVAERSKTADSVLQSTGNSTLGTTSITNLTIAGPGKINGSNTIEFGGGVAGKESNAGKIGYGTFTQNTLDIVGAGNAANGTDRKVKIWSEGGLTVGGSMAVTGNGDFSGSLSAGGSLLVGGANSQIGLNHFAYSNVTMTLQTRPAGDAYLIYGQNPAGANLFSADANGYVYANSGFAAGSVGSLDTNGLRVNIAPNIAGVMQSSSTIGTWLALQNNSSGGRAWQFISTGSGNGEGAGKLLVGYGASAGSTTSMMTFVNTNRVGINNNSPLVPLHVSGGVANFFNLQAVMDGNGARDASENRSDLVHSIISDNRVRALAFDVISDARIKTVLHPSDAAADLSTLLGIQITDYLYKDTVEQGKVPQKKVIAQQVESVYPQAITKSVGVIPDIYQRAAIAEGWVMLATDLKVGERVRLISVREEGVHEVLEVKKDRFRTAFQPADDKVFVFGREVKDFRSVDYEAIAMLNVSATQELHRKLSALEQRVTDLEAVNKTRDARLAAIEKLLPAGDLIVRKVALKAKTPGN